MLNPFTNIIMNFTNYKVFFQSKLFRNILCVIGIVVVALTIFQAGVFVGYRRASFSYRLGDNYHKTFGLPTRHGMMGGGDFFGFSRGEFTSAYGATGTIVKINLPNIIVTGGDKVEKVVSTNDSTIIRRFRDDVKVEDLKVGDSVIVIGSPNSAAQIEAKLIRVLPTAVTSATSTTQTN